LQSGMPEGVKVKTSPLDFEVIDFADSQNKNDIVGIGQQHFYDSAGSTPVLFGEKSANGVGMQAGMKTDEAYVIHMYRQFERFINFKLKEVSGRYRFKITFPDITKFNVKEKLDMYLNAAQYGFPKLLVSAALGLTPRQLVNLCNFEESLNLSGILKPLASSHTQNDNNKSGRDKLPDDQVGDEGQKKRDQNGQ